MSHARGQRLASVAKFVRQGACFSDIGTDHAYLPLLLLSSGRIDSAVCTDINEGPLATARKNAQEAGFFDRITFRLTDGAEGLGDLGITDYAICGMGGELIADIISRAPFMRDESVRLILQPMSRQAYLRSYLVSEGFSIIEEDYSSDGGKHYVCMVAEYTADKRNISNIDAELGEAVHRVAKNEAHRQFLLTKARALKTVIAGKKTAGADASDEAELLSEIEKILGGENK